jgi:transposase
MLVGMKPYAVELRQRVLDALERSMSRKEVVTTFQVSDGSIKRWLKLRRERHTLAPRPSGRPATFTPHDDDALRDLVHATPNAILAEHTAQRDRLRDCIGTL